MELHFWLSELVEASRRGPRGSAGEGGRPGKVTRPMSQNCLEAGEENSRKMGWRRSGAWMDRKWNNNVRGGTGNVSLFAVEGGSKEGSGRAAGPDF